MVRELWLGTRSGSVPRSGSSTTIHAECADCHDRIDINVTDGRPDRTDLVFHVPVPAASWWNDIGYT